MHTSTNERSAIMKTSHAHRPVDLTSPETAKVAIQVFGNIADIWGLTASERQRLLGIGQSTFYRWKDGLVTSGLDASVQERLSYVLRIYAALQILLPVPERAASWVKQPNSAPLFGGEPALSRMLGGKVGDLMVVADYLDAQRGGDFS